jgi:predicted transcriptional regulator
MVKKLHPAAAELLAEIEAYRARSGIDRTSFGRQAMNNGNFITRLEHGTIPTLSTIDRVRAFINDNTKATQPKRTKREIIRHLIATTTYDSRGHRIPRRRTKPD